MFFLTHKILAVAAASALGLPVAAGTAHTPDAPVLIHLDPATGQQPENLALEPDGSADLTFAYSGQVARVDPAGHVRILTQVPIPADGDVPGSHTKIFLGGIVRAPDGTLYFAVSTGTPAGTGVYRLRTGQAPVRIAALPAAGFLNGMAADWPRGRLYVADSAEPVIWTVPVTGGSPRTWATGDTLTPSGGFGANGLKVHDGAVWVSNIGAGTLIRIPITHDGASGVPHVMASGLGPIDDFAFAGHAVLAAINQENKVIRIDDGVTTVLTTADGLDNPTSVAVRDQTVYVTNGAYFGGDDPSLLILRQ